MALSLYRKYRPNVFADVVGQEHVERTLVNAVTEGSVAHAYLFCGPRGTGKTTTARLLAKALLCEAGPNAEPDGTCGQCVAVAQGAHPDVYELDAASRTGVENVREEIIGRVNFAPTRGRYKVYIVDEVHMLSTAAFNALLKTLEEPPGHVVFVLCTTDPQKVPETIQSRCQRFDFKRFSIGQIVEYLERICAGEGFTYEREALELIAVESNGGMRDATTALEQLAVFSDGAVTLDGTDVLFAKTDKGALADMANHIGSRDAAGCFAAVAELAGAGVDFGRFAHDLAGYFRDLYVTELTGGEGGVVSCTADDLELLRKQAASFGASRLSRALTLLADLASELRFSSDARLSVEVALVRLCRPDSELSLEALAERVDQLERGGAARTVAPAFEPVEVPQPKQAPVHGDAPLEERPQAESDSAVTSRVEEQSQPQPQPQPQPAQSPSGRPAMSLARVFQAALTDIKREDVSVGALLNGCSLEEDQDGYRLVFPPTAGFAMRVASKDPTRAQITDAFVRALGKQADIAFTTDHVAGQAGNGVPGNSDTPVQAWDEAPQDDGYFDALASSASFYGEEHVPAGSDMPADAVTQASPAFDQASRQPAASEGEPFFVEPGFDDPFASGAKKIDDATAASLADTLSAFGAGIKLQEIDTDE